MTSKIVVNNIEADSGVSTVTFNSKVASSEFVGSLTGTASTATAAATAYGISGSPTLSGISSVSTTNLTVNGNAYPSAGPLSNRNLIINGAMNVAQRATQVTGATSGSNYTCDRFSLNISSLGTWTLDQSSDAPSGFNNSLKATCTTADASPAAGDNVQFLYKVEAQDLQSLSYGNSGAKAAILSFWVKSNKTGNATVEFFQSDNSNRMLSQQYTINSADTWEYKTISLPADTSGLFNDDNGLGMEIGFWLNTGSTFTSGALKTTWGAYSAGSRNPSNLGVGGAISDYFAITGVQLELGTVATPFEYRSYGDELARCQRYFYMHADGSQLGPNNRVPVSMASAYNTTSYYGTVHFPVTMRSYPTLYKVEGTSYFRAFGNASSDLFDSITLQESGRNAYELNYYGNVSATQGYAYWVSLDNSAARIGFSAEL